MKKTIQAKVVAKALSFPDQIEIDYYPVDEFGRWGGPGIYTKGPFTWEEVKLRFGLDETYAAECEGFFRRGTGAFIQGPKDVEGDWLEPGDPGYDEPQVSEP